MAVCSSPSPWVFQLLCAQVINANNNTVIKAAIITAEFLFGSNESCMVYAAAQGKGQP